MESLFGLAIAAVVFVFAIVIAVMIVCIPLGLIYGASYGIIILFKKIFSNRDLIGNYICYYKKGKKSFAPGLMERVIFNNFFTLLFTSSDQAFKEARNVCQLYWQRVKEAWYFVDRFISKENVTALFSTAYYGPIGLMTLVFSYISDILFTIALFSLILIIDFIFMVYSLLTGLIFGIVNSFYFYIASLLQETFHISLNWKKTI